MILPTIEAAICTAAPSKVDTAALEEIKRVVVGWVMLMVV